MKRLSPIPLASVLILAMLALAAPPTSAQPTATAAATTIPVELPTDDDADPRCAGVKPAWTDELRNRLPEFRSTWDALAPAWTRAVTDLTHQPFTPVGPVRLTLCDVRSNAFAGVTVNMRYALRAFTDQPVPLRYKVDTAFHELLHGFVSDHSPSASALLAAQSSEPFCVRKHLHLLALQKGVLLKLGDPDALAQVVALDSQLPSGCYRRAWSIVNQTESGYLAYIAELAK